MLHDHIIGTALKELKIDLDDDLYLYYYNKNDMFIKLWEFYEIHETIPRKKLFYGNWTLSHGLKLIDQEKWIRRRDLQGASLRLMSGNWGVFTQMTPIKGNLFEFNGMYPEFLFNFQVFWIWNPNVTVLSCSKYLLLHYTAIYIYRRL